MQNNTHCLLLITVGIVSSVRIEEVLVLLLEEEEEE